jgi:hypothetical protein
MRRRILPNELPPPSIRLAAYPRFSLITLPRGLSGIVYFGIVILVLYGVPGSEQQTSTRYDHLEPKGAVAAVGGTLDQSARDRGHRGMARRAVAVRAQV